MRPARHAQLPRTTAFIVSKLRIESQHSDHGWNKSTTGFRPIGSYLAYLAQTTDLFWLGLEAQEYLILDAWRSGDGILPVPGDTLEVEDLSHWQEGYDIVQELGGPEDILACRVVVIQTLGHVVCDFGG